MPPATEAPEEFREIQPDADAEPERDEQPDTPPSPAAAEPEQDRPRPRPKRTRQPSFEKRLEAWFGTIEERKGPAGEPAMYATGIAGILYITDPRDGMVVAMAAPNLASAWAAVADESPRAKRMLEFLMSGGAWGNALIQTLTVLGMIAANHGIDLRQLAAPAFRIPHAPDEQQPAPAS